MPWLEGGDVDFIQIEWASVLKYTFNVQLRLTTLTASSANVFSRARSGISPLLKFGPDLCRRIGNLDDLAELVRRKNSKLRVTSGSKGTDSAEFDTLIWPTLIF